MSIDELLPLERSHDGDDEDFAMYLFPSVPRRRRISFGPDVILAHIETTQELSREEREEIWYQPEELQRMKHSARTLCQMQAKGHPISAEESIRGMDVYYPSRQLNHKKHVYHVLKAYYCHCAGNDDHVAQLSQKWSFKNKGRAAEKGLEDFYEAHFPHMVQPTQHHQHLQQLNDSKRKGSGTSVPEPLERRS
jgi:chromatin segregation and condensation protein Rec8/ScpA/Scc1 (kleisin family)